MFNTDNATHIAAPDDAAISVIITSDHKTSNIEGEGRGEGGRERGRRWSMDRGWRRRTETGMEGGELNG